MTFERHEPLNVWTIAAGVTLGILAANVIEWASASVYLNYQAAKANLAMHEAKERQLNDAQQRQRADDERETALRHAEALRQRQDAAQRQAEIDAKKRKEDAWKAYYKRPATCDDNPDTKTFTECANESIRARTQFEGTYRP